MWSVFTNRSTTDHPFSFSDLMSLQKEVLEKMLPTQGKALLFAELRPTVTLGARQVVDENQKPFKEKLIEDRKVHGVDVVSGERGGNETWHGPGQWIGFVVVPLKEFTGDPKGVRRAVYLILEKVLNVVRVYEPDAKIEDGLRLGIWSPQGKLVSVGIKIKEGYITSGFALNCIPYAESFDGIDPCGIKNALPDFLFKDRIEKSRWDSEFKMLPKKLESSFCED